MNIIDHGLLNLITEQALSSPRRRQHFNLHNSYDEPCQRLINVICSDSYIAPHRHSLDTKPETLIALQGTLGCIKFDDHGNITNCLQFASGSDCMAIVIEPTEWHTVLALSATAALIEVKSGPFIPSTAKEMAAWAEPENSNTPNTYFAQLRALFD